MSDQNTSLVEQFISAFNMGDIDRIDALCTPTYVYHGPGIELNGLEAAKGHMQMYKSAFSDASLEIVELFATGDRVVGRWRATGTNDGSLGSIAPTGKQVTLAGISIFRVENGRLAEEWELFEELQMLQQLGAIPSEAEAEAVEV